MRRVFSISVARRALLLALLCLVPAATAPATASAQTSAAATRGSAELDQTPNPWELGDILAQRMDPRWDDRIGVYNNERGFADTRINALMLQLHSMAALADHNGATRRDERIARITDVISKPPVVVTVNNKPRTTGHFPHAPAWTSSIGEDPTKAGLHPSLDTGAVRGLLAAWRARAAVKLPEELSARVAGLLHATARSTFYRPPSRALNQINWNTEIYAAGFEVSGDTEILKDYRSQLLWFAVHAGKPAYPGGSSNLTSGGGFRYLPNRKADAAYNRIETTEYGNLALSSLSWYRSAVRAGMKPLSRVFEKRLQRWSKHTLLGAWTHGGYPNWDTGLGTKRRHLRQYWAWSLDGLIAFSSRDALLGYPNQTAYARALVGRGLSLYMKTAWDPSMNTNAGPLPGKTSFDAPNGFTSGSGNAFIGPLRFAVLEAQLDGRFQDVAAKTPPDWYSHDRETGRLTWSTRNHNGGIVPARAAQSQGGAEPVRLFDNDQNPLTALGGRGPGTLGVAIVRDGAVRVDTQAAVPSRQNTSHVKLRNRKADSSSAFTKAIETTAEAHAGGGRIKLRHRISRGGITTEYDLAKVDEQSRVSVRLPAWGSSAGITVTAGAQRRGNQWVRTSGQLRISVAATGGGRFEYRLTGIPSKAAIGIVAVKADSFRPRGARQVVVVFEAPESGKLRFKRQIVVQRAK